jgi:hypothetical protein
MPTERSRELKEVAERLVAGLPPEVAEEVVLTGSVSRGVADEVSDIEMLVVTPEPLSLERCYELAAAAGVDQLGSWGDPSSATRRVSGYFDGVPVELIWSSRELAEASIEGCFAGTGAGTADAIANGVALRDRGSLARWQARLADYPEELAHARIEEAALTWGGFAAAGLLTIARPGETLARLERMVDDANRVLRLVYALNRVWPPTTKRLAARAESLAVKPERLAERIVEALEERDPRRAVLLMTELQADAVALAPDGPNVTRAREWLAEGARLLRG